MKLFLTGVFIVLFIQTNAQEVHDSVLTSSAFEDTMVNSCCRSNNTLHNIVYGTAYAGLTYSCYLFCDNDIKSFTQSHQSPFLSDVSQTIGHAGLGTSSIIITAATGITSIITNNKKLQKQLFY